MSLTDTPQVGEYPPPKPSKPTSLYPGDNALVRFDLAGMKVSVASFLNERSDAFQALVDDAFAKALQSLPALVSEAVHNHLREQVQERVKQAIGKAVMANLEAVDGPVTRLVDQVLSQMEKTMKDGSR